MDGNLPTAEGFVPLKAQAAWKPVGTEDYDGDGRADMLLRNCRSGDWFLYTLAGRVVTSKGPVALKSELDWQRVGAEATCGALELADPQPLGDWPATEPWPTSGARSLDGPGSKR